MTDAVGNLAVYTYNDDNTLANTVYTPASGVAATHGVSFHYDTAYNRVLTMADGVGTTTYHYKTIDGSTTLGQGRLDTVTVPLATTTPANATVDYGYDELGRVISRTIDGSGNSVATTFDSLGRVTGVTNPLGDFVYAYVDQTSRLSDVTYPTGTHLTTHYSYFGNTGDQRLETIQNFLNGTTNVSKFDYTYNAVGTIATWTQTADTGTAVVDTLTYDDADQLTKCAPSGSGTSNAYKYDPAGNRLAETVGTTTTVGTFNSLNQLQAYTSSSTPTTVAGHTTAPVTSATVNAQTATITSGTNFSATVPLPNGTANTVSIVAKPTDTTIPTATQRVQVTTTGTAPTALAYDANGNTTTDENGNTYQWDALNRLTAIVYNSGPHSGNTDFAYDGLSRRISITERAGTTPGTGTASSALLYLWVGSEIAEERSLTNTVTKRFFPQGEQQSGTPYFYNPRSLRQHQRINEQQRNYGCPLCVRPLWRSAARTDNKFCFRLGNRPRHVPIHRRLLPFNQWSKFDEVPGLRFKYRQMD